jgi:hypothetical protein
MLAFVMPTGSQVRFVIVKEEKAKVFWDDTIARYLQTGGTFFTTLSTVPRNSSESCSLAVQQVISHFTVDSIGPRCNSHVYYSVYDAGLAVYSENMNVSATTVLKRLFQSMKF